MPYNTNSFRSELKKIEEWLSREYSQVHTGRATPMVLDSISIESFGSRMPIKNVASVNIEDPKTLRVTPWDKNQIKEIEKAVTEANLGLSVMSDSDGVRVIFPMMTTENRIKLTKILKEHLEEARIRVRKIRQEEISLVEDLPEDEGNRAKDDIQKCVDDTNSNLEVIFSKKEVEVMN